jgi:hypothetical protein
LRQVITMSFQNPCLFCVCGYLPSILTSETSALNILPVSQTVLIYLQEVVGWLASNPCQLQLVILIDVRHVMLQRQVQC